MRRIGALILWVMVFVVWPGRAYADLHASATMSSQQIGPNLYQYSLSLTNTGTTPIGTYWFGWIPGYDLLPNMPTTVSSPAAWSGMQAGDYYGIGSVQWVTTTSPLQPGQTLGGFAFTSPDAPSSLNGTSFGLPVKESYVYIGAPETDPGFAFVTQNAPVPEPTSIISACLVLGLGICRRRRTAI